MCSSSVDMRWEGTRLIVNRSMSISLVQTSASSDTISHSWPTIKWNEYPSPHRMWSVSLAALTWQWFQRSQTNQFCPQIVFTERGGPQTGALCPAHAVYETSATLSAVIPGLGPTAPDQSAAVLLLLCRTWRVSDTAEASFKFDCTLCVCS